VETPEQALRTAHSLEVEGDIATAAEVLKDASKRWKREPEFKMRHARVLRRLGRDKKALKVFKTVIRAHPQRADAAQGAAECAQALGKAKAAEKHWSRALALGATHDVCSVGICRSMWVRGKREESWHQAVAAFTGDGSRSVALHDFLKEISPTVGIKVPDLDIMETIELDAAADARGGGQMTGGSLEAPQFSSDSLELMAGIDGEAAATSAAAIQDAHELLSDEDEIESKIDMSALALPKPIISDREKIEIPEDILDFD
jgi:tetratricopeptide (TPR) repeat protein